MTLYRFKTLTQQKQAEVVRQGHFILFREAMKYTIILYKVGDFYVEVYYNSALNTIVSFHPFSSKKRLEPYFRFRMN
jgi:hypothetical protein